MRAFMGLLAHDEERQKAPFLKYISYNDETWYSYTLPKEDLKTI